MRYKLKKDAHHTQIAHDLEHAGFAVADTSRVGHGFPDMAVSLFGVTALVEIKTAIGRKAALQRLGPAQKSFAMRWKGAIIVAYTASEIIYEFNRMLKRAGITR